MAKPKSKYTPPTERLEKRPLKKSPIKSVTRTTGGTPIASTKTRAMEYKGATFGMKASPMKPARVPKAKVAGKAGRSASALKRYL